MEEKPKKKENKKKKNFFNPETQPIQAKTYAPLHRTLRGTRKT